MFTRQGFYYGLKIAHALHNVNRSTGMNPPYESVNMNKVEQVLPYTKLDGANPSNRTRGSTLCDPLTHTRVIKPGQTGGDPKVYPMPPSGFIHLVLLAQQDPFYLEIPTAIVATVCLSL